jgi:alpha-mannosidase
MLLLQFHDILPGSSIAWVHREARDAYAGLTERLEALVGRALDALAGDGSEELVFNAAPHARGGVPALAAGPAITVEGTVSVERTARGVVLDNGLLAVTVAPDRTVASVRDLVADREVLAGPGNVLQLHPDRPNRFEAWDIDEFYRHTTTSPTELTELCVEQTTAQAATVRVVRHRGDSGFDQLITLRVGERLVRFTLDVDWHERRTLLKVAFPLDVHAATSAAEIQFGHVRRPTHTNTSWDAARFEICAHRWLQVAEAGYGVALVNDGSYGHDVTRPGPGDARAAGATTVRLSLLRSPRYPDPETDQGRHRFGYALVCGAGVIDAVREGYRFNLPARRRSGKAPVTPVVEVGPDSVVVESVKFADDRSGDLIVRLYESLGGRTRARIRTTFPTQGASVCDLLERDDPEVAALAALTPVDETTYECPFGPFQVVTIRLRRTRSVS